jgi:Helix-turn-helix domain
MPRDLRTVAPSTYLLGRFAAHDGEERWPGRHSTSTAIREARLAAGLTLRQLAERTGIHPTNLCHYEHGDIATSPAMVARIVEACR